MLIVSLTEYCLLNRYITLPLYNSHTRSPPLIVTFYPTNLAQKKSERFRKNLIRQNLGLKKKRTQSELQRSKFVLSFLRFQQNSDVFNFFGRTPRSEQTWWDQVPSQETFLSGIHFPLTIIQCINRSVKALAKSLPRRAVTSLYNCQSVKIRQLRTRDHQHVFPVSFKPASPHRGGTI